MMWDGGQDFFLYGYVIDAALFIKNIISIVQSGICQNQLYIYVWVCFWTICLTLHKYNTLLIIIAL